MNLIKYIIISLLLIVSLGSIGCSESEGKEDDANREAIKKNNVETIELQGNPFLDYISIVGTIKPYQKALISTTEGGKIVKFNKNKGDFVNKGDTIFEIDSEILKANLNAIKAQYELAKITFQKQEIIYKQNINSEIQYLQSKYGMEQLKANLEMITARYNNTFIKAPFSGYIDYKFYEEGELVQVGQPIVNLIKIKQVKIEAGVPERFVTEIKIGDMANIIVKVLDKKFTGKISFIGTSVNQTNRTFPIEVIIENNDKLLKPELITEVRIITQKFDKIISIPTEVISRIDEGYVVYIEVNGKAMSREIEILKRDGNNVAVASGLKDGDKLIVVGYQNLINEQAINVVE